MKPIFTFLAPFGFSLILNSLNAQTTHNLSWGFSSTNQQTTIDLGDTVKWTWAGGNHNLISSSGVESFDSGYSSTAGFTFSKTFNSVGQTSYVCTPHSSQMYGTITVTPPAPTGESVQLICPGVQIQSSDIDISYQSGASIKWYNSISSTSPLPSSTFLRALAFAVSGRFLWSTFLYAPQDDVKIKSER